MVLFSVLTESTTNASGEESNTSRSGSSKSSGSIPTVLQLYTGDQPIQLEEISILSGYSALTYQAIQIGSQEEEEVKNRHQTPDLGVWNCHVKNSSSGGGGSKAEPLVDALLATIATKVRVFCLTVDLSQPNQVEPSLSLLQTALVRHLIENPPTDDADTPERKTATTSLYQLQTIEFGKANEDEAAAKQNSAAESSSSSSFKSITTTLMICAKLPSLDATSENNDTNDADTYKIKQAQTFVIYHLRKFAAALNCSLCFVHPPAQVSDPAAALVVAAESSSTPASTTSSSSLQPTADYNTLSQWWRDLALDQAIWEGSSSDDPLVKSYNEDGDKEERNNTAEEAVTPETVVVAMPLYGPGKHQEDLIESVLLRSANYPGHWDASKDSLWVALPASKDPSDDVSGANGKAAGDEGWLGQLRESIASAQDLPPPGANSSPEKQSQDDKKDGKDAEVSDFFASLLKKP